LGRRGKALMPAARKKKVQYYTIVFEKYMEIVTDIDKTYYILSDKLKDMVTTIKIEEWYESPIPEFIESFLLVDSYRVFLDDKINNPTEQEVEITLKNNIKDVLFTKDELDVMQQFYLAVEARKLALIQNYNFSCYVN
jgi:hypothetical protein